MICTILNFNLTIEKWNLKFIIGFRFKWDLLKQKIEKKTNLFHSVDKQQQQQQLSHSSIEH